MADRQHLLDPPPSAVMAGYMLMRARKYIFEESIINPANGESYTVEGALLEAIECIHKASPIVASQSGMYYMQPSPGLQLITEALAAFHKIGAAHDVLRRLMKELGYRDITDRDFAALGSGGGR